ncbi:MAG: glutaredoxin family protein [Acidimicrobiales bacterium]
MTDETSSNTPSHDHPPDDAVEFFWRPGCGFCANLERALTQANVPMSKRNIWADDTAAAIVRSVANGNETVPTVRFRSHAMVNPSADEVTKLLENEAPDLMARRD